MTGKFSGDEDCLFLNVYTNVLPPTELKAVMVWIHGGCFKSGSGTSLVYSPDHLLMEDVVVVTLNYRLGTLGFLSLPDVGIPGNNGLKDQTMALRWVQTNIEKFGGDPNRVTIFGESAGGTSVHLHLLSPMSKGLFHRAISQSGSALHDWAYGDAGFMREKAFAIGERMGCEANNMSALLHCFEKSSAELIVNSTEGKEFSISDTVVPVRPTMENEKMSDEEVFLPGSPLELISNGKFHNVPYITGINSREGLIYMKDIEAIPGFWDDPRHHLAVVVGDLLMISVQEADELVKMALSYYVGQHHVFEEHVTEVLDMFSDLAFVRGTVKTVRKHVELSHSPVYMYMFSYDGELGIIKTLLNTNMEGVSHADELGYLFHIAISPELEDDTQEMTTLRRMVRMWTNFARTGDPTVHLDNLVNVKWSPVTKLDNVYMNISNELCLQHRFYQRRMQFWDDVLG